MRIIGAAVVGIVLALASPAVAQVKCQMPDGSTKWVTSADETPGCAPIPVRLPSVGGTVTAPLVCDAREQREIEEASAAARSVRSSQNAIAAMQRSHDGTYESVTHLEARLAAERRDALAPLEHERECLEINYHKQRQQLLNR